MHAPPAPFKKRIAIFAFENAAGTGTVEIAADLLINRRVLNLTVTIIEYAKESNVLTFKQFFSEEIAVRRKARWLALGL